jgi:hypothetical protein
MLIADPGSGSRIPDPGVRKAPDPGSGTLVSLTTGPRPGLYPPVSGAFTLPNRPTRCKKDKNGKLRNPEGM